MSEEREAMALGGEFHCKYCGNDIHLAPDEASPEAELARLRQALAKAKQGMFMWQTAAMDLERKLAEVEAEREKWMQAAIQQQKQKQRAKSSAAALEALLEAEVGEKRMQWLLAKQRGERVEAGGQDG